jgi:16S rRNA (guanine966-N2)-methyltransferase
VRVIAGEHKGRKLRTTKGTITRPTAGRVREALFSSLGPLEGERVLDLFAGSGALGIEALSRGAGQALFVEADRHALSALRANLETLGLDEPQAEIRAAEAIRTLQDLAKSADVYDLVLLDPPYDSVDMLSTQLARTVPAVLASGARVVCESDRRSPLQLPLPIAFERRYGDTLLTIHTT